MNKTRLGLLLLFSIGVILILTGQEQIASSFNATASAGIGLAIFGGLGLMLKGK